MSMKCQVMDEVVDIVTWYCSKSYGFKMFDCKPGDLLFQVVNGEIWKITAESPYYIAYCGMFLEALRVGYVSIEDKILL